MGWLALVSLIIQLLLKAPEYIEQIKKWLELIRGSKGLKLAGERAKLGGAINQLLSGEAFQVCPVKFCVADLEARLK